MTRLRTWLTDWAVPAATVQAIAIALAALVGGCWAVYSFSALQNAERAALEVSQLTRQQAYPSVETEITVSQATKQGRVRPVLIDVHLTNHGLRLVVLDLTEESLGFAEVPGDSSYPRRATKRVGSPYISRLWPTKIVGGGFLPLPSGSKRNLSYVFYVRRPGVYLVDFEAPVIMRPDQRDFLLRAYGIDSAIKRVAPMSRPNVIDVSASRFVEIK